MSMHNIIILTLRCLFFASTSHAQGTDGNFESKESYLKYSLDTYGINSNEIYYVPVNTNGREEKPLEKFSLLMFFKNDSIATIEDISNNAACSASKILKKTSVAAIKNSFAKSATAGNIIFKNMGNETLFKPKKDELIAVLFYSYKFGDAGQEYIEVRDKIAKEFNVKTLILTIDGGYISGTTDMPKNAIKMYE